MYYNNTQASTMQHLIQVTYTAKLLGLALAADRKPIFFFISDITKHFSSSPVEQK